jgi:hypothetical protein
MVRAQRNLFPLAMTANVFEEGRVHQHEKMGLYHSSRGPESQARALLSGTD